jgi:hypothetical protein
MALDPASFAGCMVSIWLTPVDGGHRAQKNNAPADGRRSLATIRKADAY